MWRKTVHWPTGISIRKAIPRLLYDSALKTKQRFSGTVPVRVMKEIKPKLIKLDFDMVSRRVGTWAPHAGPALRGEKRTFALMQQVAKVAKSVDPDVVSHGCGIESALGTDYRPCFTRRPGDLWYDLHRGHQEWSVWASLLIG